jgi:flagellar protein FlhE
MDLILPAGGAGCGEGMWQASSMGVTLSNRGVSMSSNPLSPPDAVSGLMTMVVWNYRLIGPTPAGLRVRLCSQTRCTEIDGKVAPRRRSTVCQRWSLYTLSGKCRGGRLIPALNVQSNSVIVNYR